jgi:hypothetical protein
MVRVNLIEVDQLGNPLQYLGACLMPHSPREKELVHIHGVREVPFVVVRVLYDVTSSGVYLTSSSGQMVNELTLGSCEVHVR